MKKLLFLLLSSLLVPAIVSAQTTYQYYIRAAKKGDADAQFRIGSCYSKGSGVEKDEKKAFQWWSKAAKQGHAISQGLIGHSYEVGQGVTKDYSQAAYWYRKAADQGNAVAQMSLALCYTTGNGVQKDYTQAFNWSYKAAVQGLANAQYWVGMCYSNGSGVAKDVVQAFNWYRKAAEQGFASAQLCVGYSYCEGIGVSKDYSQSIYWLQKSLDNGESKASTYLAIAKKKKQEQEVETKTQYRNKALNGEIKGIVSRGPDPMGNVKARYLKGDSTSVIGYSQKGDTHYYALCADYLVGTFKDTCEPKYTFKNSADINFNMLPAYDDPEVMSIIQQKSAILDSIQAIKRVQTLKELNEFITDRIEVHKKNKPFVISDIYWSSNSAGGIEVSLSVTNCSGQTIKYVTFQGYFINAVGDKCRNDISGSTIWKARGIGPIGPCPTTPDNYYDRVNNCSARYNFDDLTFYSKVASTFRLSSVIVEYTNGSKVTLTGANLNKHVRY